MTILTPFELADHLLTMRSGMVAVLARWNKAVLVCMAKDALKQSMSLVATQQFGANIIMATGTYTIRCVRGVANLQRRMWRVTGDTCSIIDKRCMGFLMAFGASCYEAV